MPRRGENAIQSRGRAPHRGSGRQTHQIGSRQIGVARGGETPGEHVVDRPRAWRHAPRMDDHPLGLAMKAVAEPLQPILKARRPIRLRRPIDGEHHQKPLAILDNDT